LAEWIECGDAFIEADVIRFWEGIWERRGPKARQRPVKVGDRVVIAEVLRDEGDGWIVLLVLGCEVKKAKPSARTLLKEGGEIRRKRSNVCRRKVERLPWSDEGARASVVASGLSGAARRR
jgi:hypothetical protein